MNINELYPSDYLKAANITQPVVMTIRTVTQEEIGPDKTLKPVVFFNEESRGLVLNKTNATMISHAYGNETDSWLGKPVELHVEPVPFQAQIVDAIRVRIPLTQVAQVAAPQTIAQPTVQPTAVATQPPVVPPGTSVAAATAAKEFINDDVDF